MCRSVEAAVGRWNNGRASVCSVVVVCRQTNGIHLCPTPKIARTQTQRSLAMPKNNDVERMALQGAMKGAFRGRHSDRSEIVVVRVLWILAI